jgi:hypothetical protein
VCDCYIKFSEGHKEASNLLHAHIKPAAVCDVNIFCVQELILGSRQITACDIAFSSGISVGNVEAVNHEYILLKKVCAWWVPKMLLFNKVTLIVMGWKSHEPPSLRP